MTRAAFTMSRSRQNRPDIWKCTHPEPASCDPMHGNTAISRPMPSLRRLASFAIVGPEIAITGRARNKPPLRTNTLRPADLSDGPRWSARLTGIREHQDGDERDMCRVAWSVR